MEAINKQTAGDKLHALQKHPGSLVLFLLVVLAACVTFAVLIFLIAYILIRGVPYLTPELFSLHCFWRFPWVSFLPFIWWNTRKREINSSAWCG